MMPAEFLSNPFSEIVILLLVATLAGVAATRLRQPLIIGFIAVGILVGPAGLGLIKSRDQIHMLAEMGLALLLFVVGLRLDLSLIRNVGPVALLSGVGQVVFTTIGGFAIALVLGMTPLTALYVAVALTFSSTIIIVKLLSDKGETDSLHGRIALGFLIVQDIIVVLAMIGLSSISGEVTGHPVWQVILILLKGIVLFASVWVIAFYIFPRLLPSLARSGELLVLFGITWALAMAMLSQQLGFSKEVGAFLAGIALASTEYRDILGAKLVSLRDFLLLFFFLELGSRLELNAISAQVLSSIPLSLFVLVGNPIIVMVIMGVMGYRRRTSFLAGLTVAQISEFSLILIAMGAQAGHISGEAVGVVTLVGLITIALSTYLILYSHHLYDWFSPYLRIFERKAPFREDARLAPETDGAEIIMFGLGRYGTSIAQHLLARGRNLLGVDFDPQAVAHWNARGWRAVFGDAEDTEFTAGLPLASARWIVSTIRDPQINTTVVRALRHNGYLGSVAFPVQDREEALGALAEADLVFIPFEDAAERAVELLTAKEDYLARKAMDKLIDSISDHYIICGYGRMGQQIVKDLGRHHVPYVVVESNPEQLPKLKEHGIPHVAGRASDDEVLTQAGISRARGLIAVAATDEENVFIVLTARVLNPSLYIVARSIMEENEDKIRRAGANRVMSPYILGGRRMATAITQPGVMDFLDLVVHTDHIETDIQQLAVPAGSWCVGRSLQEVNIWQSCGATVLAVQRRGEDIHANPCPDYVLQEGDELFVMGTAEQIAAGERILYNGE